MFMLVRKTKMIFFGPQVVLPKSFSLSRTCSAAFSVYQSTDHQDQSVAQLSEKAPVDCTMYQSNGQLSGHAPVDWSAPPVDCFYIEPFCSHIHWDFSHILT